MDTDQIQHATPPSTDEGEGYYYGLKNPPVLIARSSHQPWIPRYNSTSQVGKAVDTIGHHPIVDLWDKIYTELKEPLSSVEYISLSVIRIGYEDDGNEWPPVLWIGVDRKWTSWPAAQRCIQSCCHILETYGMSDVECEIAATPFRSKPTGPPPRHIIKASSTQLKKLSTQLKKLSTQLKKPSTQLKKPSTQLKTPPTQLKASSTYLKYDFDDWWSTVVLTPGHGLAKQGPPNRYGTLGLFMKPDNSDRIFGLTCRHIVYSVTELSPMNTLQDNVCVIRKGSDIAGEKRSRVAYHCPRNAKRKLDEGRHDNAEEEKGELLIDRGSTGENFGTVNPLPKGKCQTLGRVLAADGAERVYKGKQTHTETGDREWPTLSKRAANCEKEEEEDRNAIKWRQDWLVFEVEPRYLRDTTTLGNVVYIGKVNQSVRDKMAEDPALDESILQSSTMRLIYTKSSMMPQPKKGEGPKSSHSRRVVGKRGKSTNTTWGSVNEIRSRIVDYVYSNGSQKAVETESICILPIDCESFTSPGDSRSIAFDLRGQVVAMMRSEGFGGLAFGSQIE